MFFPECFRSLFADEFVNLLIDVPVNLTTEMRLGDRIYAEAPTGCRERPFSRLLESARCPNAEARL